MSEKRRSRGLRVVGPLSPAPDSARVVASAGRGRTHARWVLRPLPSPAGGELRSLLRPDFCDLVSIEHADLLLPLRLVRDGASDNPHLLRPFIEGVDIAAAVQALRPREAVPWLLAAAESLAVLHRAGLAHGNLKPSNLIVPRSSLRGGSRQSPRVLVADPAWWPLSPPSEAPARAGGGEPLPSRSPASGSSLDADIRVLGGLFHVLITGRPPRFDADGLPAPASELNPDVPQDLDRLLLKLLNPQARSRHDAAGALAHDLRRLCGDHRPEHRAVPECLVGRKEEIERAQAALASARPAVLAVAGEAGAGKSAFIRRLEWEAEVLGYRCVVVHCYRERAGPLQPLRDAIEEILAPPLDLEPGRRSRRADRQALAARMRRLLRVDAGDHPAPPGMGGRRALVAALAELVLDAARDRRTLLLVDEAHFAGELSIETFAALARSTRARAAVTAPDPAPFSLALSFRSESPFLAALKPLTEALDSVETVRLDLGPLPSAAVHSWIDIALGDDPAPKERLRCAHGPVGHPLSVREALLEAASVQCAAPRNASRPGDLGSVYADYARGLGEGELRILEVLAVLGRPATLNIAARVLGEPRAAVRRAAESLARGGTLDFRAGLVFFRHGSFASWLLESLPEAQRRSLHRRVAQSLAARRGAAAEELARHWLASDEPARGIDAALEAARCLVRLHEDRSAARLYRRVLDLLPDAARRRAAVAEEAAAAHARAGEHRAGIDLLAGLLARVRTHTEEARLLARLGVLRHRLGDLDAAVEHLTRALGLIGRKRGPAAIRERLRIRSELAEIANNRGDYSRAEEISRAALDDVARTPAKDRDPGVVREEMVLLGTLAHLELRRFKYDRALDLFQRSLEVGKSLGPVPEKSLILSNLGTLHAQESRFREALRAFEEAGRLSTALLDDPALAVLCANLAVLHARLGDPRAADEALRRAALHDALCDSARVHFLRQHSEGLASLSLGRLEAAIGCFHRALALGEELEDRHLSAFDRVHLAECQLYRGELKTARSTLEAVLALGEAAPAPAAAAARARLALAAALRADARAFSAATEGGEGAGARELPAYVEAWNRVHLGWALRLMGRRDEARAELEAARDFFVFRKLAAGRIHAEVELALVEAEEGRLDDAEQRLRKLRGGFTHGEGVLANPALGARLLLYHAKVLLDRRPPDLDPAAALLVEAETSLIGQRLRDLDGLATELRRRLRLGRGEGAVEPHPAPHSAAPSGALSAVRRAAAALRRTIEAEIGAEQAAVLLPLLERMEREALGLARGGDATGGHSPGAVLTASLGRSQAMREVIAILRQIAPSRLPVLITGETGSGKEVVARAVHAESPRRSAPFVSINCAALPEQLLEAELFGYTRGAFSGAEDDHVGLLAGSSGGSFLFDEVAELPLALQGKLLRFLDRGAVRPLGSVEEVEVDVRVLFATNRDLAALVEEGKFRRDLFFRAGGLEVRVPPLRARIEDLTELVARFSAEALGAARPELFDDGARRVLAAHSWPGNVRELRNLVTRLALTCEGTVTAEAVRAALGDSGAARGVATALFPAALLRSRPLGDLLGELERSYLEALHTEHGGDLAAVARALGIGVRALYNRFRRLGLRPGEME